MGGLPNPFGGGLEKTRSTVTKNPGVDESAPYVSKYDPSTWVNGQPPGGAGLQTGKAQPQMQGLDFSKPGAGEAYFGNNGMAWQSPSYGEVNNQGLVSQYSDPNARPQVTNNTQTWFDSYSANMPSIASDPGLAPYYENAKNRAAESIAQSTAARGSYGSSSANDQTARAFTDLEADRAQKEAQYNLQRLGEQRAWESLGGQLAGSADASSRAVSENEQNWINLLSQLGISASQLGLDRTNAGMDAAMGAQGAQRTRGQDYFQNQLAMGDRVSDIYSQFMLPALDNDAALMGQSASGGIAQGNQQLANEQANAQTTSDALQTGLSLYDKYKAP